MWARFYVVGPLGGLALAVTDAGLIAFTPQDATPAVPLAVASVLGIGLTAFLAAYASDTLGAGAGAAALAALVAAPLDALVVAGVLVYVISTPEPAGQAGCRCGPGPVGVLFLVAVIVPALLFVLRLGLLATVGLLSAWLGARVR